MSERGCATQPSEKPLFNLVSPRRNRAIFACAAWRGNLEGAMRLGFRLCGTGFLLAFTTAAGAQIVAPPGYETIPLVDSSGQPFAPNGLTVGPTGEMATLSND